MFNIQTFSWFHPLRFLIDIINTLLAFSGIWQKSFSLFIHWRYRIMQIYHISLVLDYIANLVLQHWTYPGRTNLWYLWKCIFRIDELNNLRVHEKQQFRRGNEWIHVVIQISWGLLEKKNWIQSMLSAPSKQFSLPGILQIWVCQCCVRCCHQTWLNWFLLPTSLLSYLTCVFVLDLCQVAAVKL